MIPTIERLPRIPFGFYPTPITDAKHLANDLAGPRILIKREDLSGLAMGGNKARKLEFILAEAQNHGATTIISTASAQSNFCLQMAAAGRKLGMKSRFVLFRGVHNETQGNLLLQNVLGSEIEILETSDMRQVQGDFISDKLDEIAELLAAQGEIPYVVKHNLPETAAILGVVGWALAAEELRRQFDQLGIDPEYILLANGGGGTQAGLELGRRLLNAKWRIIGIPVLNKNEISARLTADQVNAVADFLGISIHIEAEELELHDEYLGDGYGIPTSEGLEAIRRVARTEAIFLDPVYTSKGMAGLIDLAHKGRFQKSETVVFIHTGGVPALFAYQPEVVC